MAELAYGSGLRRGELERLNIEDIDLENGTAQVRGKGGKMRIVPLTAITIEFIRRVIADRKAYRGPLLVSFTGRRLGGGAIGWIFAEKIGIRPHLLRHACATHMLRNGCNLRVIQDLLGHARLTTTMLYTHINKRDLQKVVNGFHPLSGKVASTAKKG